MRALWALLAAAPFLVGRSAAGAPFQLGIAGFVLLGLAWLVAAGLRDIAYLPEWRWFNAAGLMAPVATRPLTALAVTLAAGTQFADRRRTLLAAVMAGGVWLMLVEAGLAASLAAYAAQTMPAAGAQAPASVFQAVLSGNPAWLLLPVLLVVLLPVCLAAVRTALGPGRALRAAGLWVALGLIIAFLPSPIATSPSYWTPERNLSAIARELAWERATTWAAASGWLPAARRDARADEEANEEPAELAYDPEQVLAQQDALLDAAFKQLRPQRSGKRDLYTLTVAGYGHQNVFRSETGKVDVILRDRVAGAGHGISLVNHPLTTATTPLASPRNLGAALKRLGTVMDRKDDVLFLFLTSHGSPRRFSLTLEGMPYDALRPRQLRRMLDASGIKHRVIMVSACFSGSFVNDLKDPHTLIMTAARRDRSSFGCSDENIWTWFGDAYFNHALREETNFVAAFAKARALIETWEKRDDMTPSEPQIAVGANIEAVLKGLEPAASNLP